ncbi:MAG TPA: hypothetical protein VHT74_03615 [Acetobacteraceae bacterium]|jgi:hypothetical protein|nr:hypothetical protein [Acetobacteraceae bacterium]
MSPYATRASHLAACDKIGAHAAVVLLNDALREQLDRLDDA